MNARVAAVSFTLIATGCRPPVASNLAAPSVVASALADARSRIATMDDSHSRTDRLRVTFDSPWLSEPMSARGAVSISRPEEKSLRLLLVGPGGTTAMDLWLRQDRYRLALPALDRIIRGSLHDALETRRALPVDFLAWWMLAPFDGELLWAVREEDALRVILRRASAYVDVRLFDSGSISAVRRVWSSKDTVTSEETIKASGLRCPYDVTYFHHETRLRVAVTCETTSDKVNSAAFREPETSE